MVWTWKENARKQTATENFRMGTRGNAKKGKTHRQTDGVRRSMTNHGLTEEDTRDRDRWRNLVLGEGKPL
jgi:cysteinyl-tRNA synthetase